jgi:hypothetical protein
MAQLMVDDLDKLTPAERTVLFSLDGKDFEIDLSPANVCRLQEEFGAWIDCARRPGKPAAKGMGSARQAKESSVTRLLVVPTSEPLPLPELVEEDAPFTEADTAGVAAEDRAEFKNPEGADPALRKVYAEMRHDARAFARTHGWPDLGVQGRLPDDLCARWKDAMGWTGDLFAEWLASKSAPAAKRVSPRRGGPLRKR